MERFFVRMLFIQVFCMRQNVDRRASRGVPDVHDPVRTDGGGRVLHHVGRQTMTPQFLRNK